MSDDGQNRASPAHGAQRSGGSVSRPSNVTASTSSLRSCVTCRRRKVKCDKKNPCSNCVRTKIECVFPGPGRAPRKSRKPVDAELLERLRRLEGAVSSLNAQVVEREQEAAEREKEKQSSPRDECSLTGQSNASTASSPSVAIDNSVEGLENRFGRLVVEKGRSRYINNSFWASLNNEVEDLKTILIDPADDDEDVKPPDSFSTASHQGFIFGYSSTSVDMQLLHPGEEQARQFWEVYKENVDPLVKVLHTPTFEPTFLEAAGHLDKLPKPLEAMIFAVYYGAVTSTSPKECLSRWGEDRAMLIARYRFGLEQALARANFLYRDEILILQAFCVFLVLLRRNDDVRKIWTLTGLLVRIAQTLGVHRDGSHFGLPPFEIEMRRRLWWQVCMLDTRSSEDHGCDPTIVEAQFDTKLPLNVNDVDLVPGMLDFPEEREGFTDMTLCLLRYEIANVLRRILYIPPGPSRCNELFANLSNTDKEKWIMECHQRMENKYLKNNDMSIPLCWVTATISRLIMSKMWLIVYHPHQRKDGGATLPQETKDKLFITSLENIEYSILLGTEARTKKWGWLFRTCVQWHAIAFLLSELCVRTKGGAVERAWKALETTAGRWWFPLNDTSSQRKGEQGTLWRPLRKLLAKARAARERALALERASLALQKSQFAFGFPQDFTAANLYLTTPDQANSENLDKLPRPTAAKLGEPPGAPQPSWPQSLPTPETQGSRKRQIDGMSKQRQLPSGSFRTSLQGSQSPAQEFQALSSFGLDTVLLDVMDDMTYEGKSFADTPDAMTQQSHADEPNNSQPFDVNGTLGGLSGPGFGANAWSDGNLDFTATSPTLNNNGQQVQSPISGDGSMDWTLWDDMVNEYGHEGQTANPANLGVNGLGHLGLLHWI